jgi:hypothetical protein
MPNTPLTRRQGAGLAKMIIIGLLVQIAVIGYVFYQSYAGREEVVNSQRLGCERGKLDRKANALGWRAAEQARIAEFATEQHLVPSEAKLWLNMPHRPSDPYSLIAARRYDKIATGLENRGRITCAVVYPKPGLLP